MKFLACLMLAQVALGVSSTCVHAAPFAAQASASETADLRCNEMMKALSAGNYTAATAHFDPTMKAGFSPERLGSMWQSLTAAHGKLVRWEVTERSTARCQESIVAPLKFDRDSNLAAFISVNPTGEVSELYFAPTPVTTRSAAPAMSPPSGVARNFDSIDVNVGPLEVCGTITMPTTGAGPWPGVVLLGGAGAVDKDETIGPNHIFKDIAEGLSSHGIVVLRYDKRTLAYAEEMRLPYTIKEEYLDDGLAAVKLLRSRPEVAKDRIFIAGHSEGSTVAAEVAVEAVPVTGLILLGPGVTKAGTFKVGAWVVRVTRFLGQTSPEQLAELEGKANEVDNHQMPSTEKFLGHSASYWYDLEGRNIVAHARQLNVPILILHGARDFQSNDEDIEHWQEGLKGIPHLQVITIPALNHMFLAGTGRPDSQKYMIPGHVDQRVIDAMSAFIKNPFAK